MSGYELKLFIAGNTARSTRAVENIRYLCDNRLGEECRLSIVDVLERPDQAEGNRILATPTLVKMSPPPEKRVIGDLTDFDQVVLALGLGVESEGESGRIS